MKYLAVFVLTLGILTGAMVLAALIAKDSIRENMISSAGHLCDRAVFFNVVQGVNSSRIDYYADSILLSIAYHMDDGQPLVSAMKCEYYYSPLQNENENLRDTVNEGYPANQQYLRYWHGSVIPVKIMHLFTDIRGMYITNAVILAILTLCLLILLIKNGLYAGAFGILLSYFAAGIIYVPYCLEYIWVFLLANVFNIAVVYAIIKGRSGYLGIIFLLSGMITNYLDFLTSETLTFLIPVLLAVYTAGELGKQTDDEICSIKPVCDFGFLWGFGYVGTWIMKWVIASLVMGENAMPYVSEHVAERVGEVSAGISGQALIRNISSLLPYGYGAGGALAALLIVIALAYVGFVYRKKRTDINNKRIMIYLLIGAIPYLRYILLRNHSYLHYFFTYRAQAATVLAICLAIYEATDVGLVRNAVRKRRRV